MVFKQGVLRVLVDRLTVLQERKSKKSKKHKHRDRDHNNDRDPSPATGRSPRDRRRHDEGTPGRSDVEVIERDAEPDLEALREEARQAMTRTMSTDRRG